MDEIEPEIDMEENKIEVDNTEIGGKFVGRDDNSFTYQASHDRSVYLEKLYSDYQLEIGNGTELKEFCEEFDYYYSQIENDELIGLENKLIVGGKRNLYNYAKGVKEKFHKKLLFTSQYSPIAQDINVHLLAKVKRSFMLEIFTLICNKESEEKIHLMITERIIKPVKAELGLNVFKYTEDDIMGMIFFLTGNCHIKWSE